MKMVSYCCRMITSTSINYRYRRLFRAANALFKTPRYWRFLLSTIKHIALQFTHKFTRPLVIF